MKRLNALSLAVFVALGSIGAANAESLAERKSEEAIDPVLLEPSYLNYRFQLTSNATGNVPSLASNNSSLLNSEPGYRNYLYQTPKEASVKKTETNFYRSNSESRFVLYRF